MSGHARKLSADQEDRLSVWRAIAEKRAPYAAALLYASRYVNVPGIETLGAVDPRLRVFLDMGAMDRDYSDDESAQVLFTSCTTLCSTITRCRWRSSRPSAPSPLICGAWPLTPR